MCREELAELGWIDDVIVFVYTYTVLDNTYPVNQLIISEFSPALLPFTHCNSNLTDSHAWLATSNTVLSIYLYGVQPSSQIISTAR